MVPDIFSRFREKLPQGNIPSGSTYQAHFGLVRPLFQRESTDDYSVPDGDSQMTLTKDICPSLRPAPGKLNLAPGS